MTCVHGIKKTDRRRALHGRCVEVPKKRKRRPVEAEPKMSSNEAKDILVDHLIVALNCADSVSDIIDIWDDDEKKDLIKALRVMAGNSIANSIRKKMR